MVVAEESSISDEENAFNQRDTRYAPQSGNLVYATIQKILVYDWAKTVCTLSYILHDMLLLILAC
jgi:hypothetical protein